MNKYFYILLLLITVCSCGTKSNSITTGQEGKPIPNMTLLLLDSSTHINTHDLQLGTPVVLIYFSPNCPYCRSLTKDIVENIKSFENIKLYMISNFSIRNLKTYSNHYHLQNYSNITVAQDLELKFPNYFKSPAVPFLAIYGKNNLLKQALLGAVSPEIIKNIALN